MNRNIVPLSQPLKIEKKKKKTNVDYFPLFHREMTVLRKWHKKSKTSA